MKPSISMMLFNKMRWGINHLGCCTKTRARPQQWRNSRSSNRPLMMSYLKGPSNRLPIASKNVRRGLWTKRTLLEMKLLCFIPMNQQKKRTAAWKSGNEELTGRGQRKCANRGKPRDRNARKQSKGRPWWSRMLRKPMVTAWWGSKMMTRGMKTY